MIGDDRTQKIVAIIVKNFSMNKKFIKTQYFEVQNFNFEFTLHTWYDTPYKRIFPLSELSDFNKCVIPNLVSR